MSERRAAARVLVGCVVCAIAVCASTAGRAADDPGERVYDRACRRCHGSEGRGGQGPSLIPFDWTYEEALDLVRHPRCDMPPIPASVLSDAEVAQIVAYLKTIK
jgi:mono/diheme cytochrome c family protein